MSNEMDVLCDGIESLLAINGPTQSCGIIAAMWPVPFRKVDRAIQRLRKQGRITLLPRVKGERPFPLWEAK